MKLLKRIYAFTVLVVFYCSQRAKEHGMENFNLMDRLIDQFRCYFDVEQPYSIAGFDFAAYAHYYQNQQKYVLVRRAKLYGLEMHEHVFFLEVELLTQSVWESLKAFIIAAEKDFVKPHSEHMYSYMTLLLVCGSIEAAVKEDIRKTKYTKNYKFSLYGYSTVRVGAMDVSDETIFTNWPGRDLKRVFRQALHA